MAVDWATSDAKKLLKKHLRRGVISLEANNPYPKVLWDHYRHLPEFVGVTKTQFSTNIQSLRKLIKKKKDRKDEEEAGLRRDLERFPPSLTNHRGEPHWHLSAAPFLLVQDIDAELHKDLLPIELWSTRDEYMMFSLKVFRKHIYQEIRTRKFQAYLEFKANNPAAYKALNPDRDNDDSDDEDTDDDDAMSL
jgi:hypothetical protein